jgi:hypothetical protein
MENYSETSYHSYDITPRHNPKALEHQIRLVAKAVRLFAAFTTHFSELSTNIQCRGMAVISVLGIIDVLRKT